MRVLFLTKQQYMAKDLLQDRFGRFYEIPKALGQSGHEIRGVCLKYRPGKGPSGTPQPCEFVQWDSFPLGRNWPLGFARHFQRLIEIATRFKPDIIVGASDCAQVVMAGRLAAKFGLPYAVDLYDNFESYRATQIPGMKHLLRRSVRQAAAVSVISDALLAKVQQQYRPKGLLRLITNAVAPEIFHWAEKSAARCRLGLPQSGTLIGTAGDLTHARGIETLFEAFKRLKVTRDHLSLILAGPIDGRVKRQLDHNIIYLGELAHERVGDLFNALDVGIICNREDSFGRYCFPQKFFEMLACKLPVVVAKVGALSSVLSPSEHFLFTPGGAASLADAILSQIETRRIPALSVPTWHDCGLMFGNLLEAAVAASTHPCGRIASAQLDASETR